MRTLKTSEINRPGASSRVVTQHQAKRMHVTMSPSSQFRGISALKSNQMTSQFGPETAVTSQDVMSTTSKTMYISRKEHKKQEELEMSAKKTLNMYTHIKFFKDRKRGQVIKSRGNYGTADCSTAASTMNPRQAATSVPSTRRNMAPMPQT